MILWLNPFSGISGDMLLGALLGAGAPLEAVREAVRSTGVEGWRLTQTTVERAGLAATQAVVSTDDSEERTAEALLDIVSRARPEPVAALAARAVTAIVQVESELHNVPPAAVHLHELSGLDTVVDTVGVAAALHALGVTSTYCGPLAVGAGTVRTEHGTLPLPAPATAELLARAGAQITSADVGGETVTPTGAALLLAIGARFGPVPTMTARAVGYGAGSRDVAGRPNVLQALLGVPLAADGGVDGWIDGAVETLTHIETNVDDVTGELLGHLVGQLLAEGAADAWTTPTVMKKGRPGHTVHVLTELTRAAACEQLLLRETGSLGLRRQRVERVALPRTTRTVKIDDRRVRVKYGPWGAKPEHDDLVEAAEALGLTVREVAERVRALADDPLSVSLRENLDLW